MTFDKKRIYFSEINAYYDRCTVIKSLHFPSQNHASQARLKILSKPQFYTNAWNPLIYDCDLKS